MSFRKPSIVVADDHAEMLSEIARALDSDYEIVASVANGVLAVEAVVKHEPDLVLLDIAMPHMNGIEAARKIRELGIQTRILFLTAELRPEYREVVQALSASYVLKAQMRSELANAIAKALRGEIPS